MLSEIKEQFSIFCKEMVAATPPNTLKDQDYILTVRLFFRLISKEIKRLAEIHNRIENLTAVLKEVGWDTLEKYRDDFMSREITK